MADRRPCLPNPGGESSAALAANGGALRGMQEASLHTREWMSRLTEAQREQAWQDTERELYRFDGPNGCELPDESLIAVGTK